MIDIENYKRAIVWLRRSLKELEQEPANDTSRIDVLHRFGVTHNVSEAILREAYTALNVDGQAPNISVREVLRRGAEEGMKLSSPGKWLQYGLLLETAKEAWFETADVDLTEILAILPTYLSELDLFATSLQRKMAPLA